MVHFEVIDEIENIESVAVGKSIREVGRLTKIYGERRWRKLKGVARIRLRDGTICTAELHWYEAHGLGKKKIKIKGFLD